MNPGWTLFGKLHDAAVFACVLVAVLCVPIPLGSNRPLAWFGLEMFVYGALAFAMLGFIADGRGLSVRKPATGILTVLCLWLGLIFVQTVPMPRGVVEALSPLVYKSQQNLALISVSTRSTLSIDPDTTYNEALKYGCYVALFFLTLVTVNTKNRLLALAGTIIAAGVLESGLGLYGHLSGYPAFPSTVMGNPAGSGTFANPNHFSSLLVMVLGVVFGLAASIVNSQKPGAGLRIDRYGGLDMAALAALAATALILAAAVFASGSRAPMVAFTFSFAVVLLMAKVAGRAAVGEYVLVPFVLVLAVIVTVLMGLDGGGASIEEGIVGREWLSQNASGLKLLSAVWASGVGAGNYRWVFPMFRDDSLRFATYDYAHDDYLQAAIEQGIPASILLGFAVWLIIRQLYKGYRNRRNTLMRGLIFGCLLSVLSMLLHSVVEFNFHIPANSVYFLVISGAGLAACRLDRGSRRSRQAGEGGGGTIDE